MNRPRTPGRKDLPRWFRARRQGAGGYYIEHPITRECSSLGTDKDEALSRAQRRYRDWLAADCGLPFGQWLARGAQ